MPNRVQEKPYVELKDSAGRPDDEVAREAWENHALRNRSVVVDLFHGQLQSTVTCKVCGHTSVRFDPFNFLSLPLPMESCVHVEVVVVRLDGSMPVRCVRGSCWLFGGFGQTQPARPVLCGPCVRLGELLQ